MRQIHAAWMGAFLVAACSGKDHSLGLGVAPAVRGTGGATAVDMTGGDGGGGAAVPEMTGGSGGAGSSGLIDSGVVAAGGAPDNKGSGGEGGRAGTGGVSHAGGSGGTGGAVGRFVPIIPPLSGECPAFQNGAITFMGLDNIQIAAGQKPSSPSAPMLVYWHGTGSTSTEYALMAAAVANGVTQAGGVIVSFQGTAGGDLYSGTNIFGVADLTIVDQLVACAVRDHNVDPRRIYTSGCSAGGLFSAAMAALRSNYVAAASSNSGGWAVPAAFQSNPYTPPLMTVHGSAGADVVIVDFAQTSATADKAFKSHGGFVIDCNTGGGHCGGSGLAGDVWKFFLAHAYGASPEPWASGLPAGFSTECKIQ